MHLFVPDSLVKSYRIDDDIGLESSKILKLKL